MKLFSGILGAVVLAALLPAGCNTAGHYEAGALKPAIMLEGPRQVSVGESQRLVAHTTDSAGAKSIQWSVEPTTAKITPESNSAGQSAMFQSSQMGRYIVKARIDPGNGGVPLESATTVDVVGGMASANR
jgi:hypothetical protein